jgi:hypothetical protein
LYTLSDRRGRSNSVALVGRITLRWVEELIAFDTSVATLVGLAAAASLYQVAAPVVFGNKAEHAIHFVRCASYSIIFTAA